MKRSDFTTKKFDVSETSCNWVDLKQMCFVTLNVELNLF